MRVLDTRIRLLCSFFALFGVVMWPSLANAHDLKGLGATRYPVTASTEGTTTALSDFPARRATPTAKANALRISKLRSDKDAAIVIASGLGVSPHVANARGFTQSDLLAFKSVVMKAKTWKSGTTIRICFYDLGENRVRIAAIANEWLQFGNLKFDFGSKPSLRTCAPSGEQSEIRITFRERPPNWVGYASLIGTDSAINKSDPSMVLRDFDQADLSDPYFQSVILHEFGHALGFHHEHQSPASDCEQQFNMAKIRSLTGWSDEEMKTNFSRLQVGSMGGIRNGFTSIMLPTGEQVAFTTYDSKSIMHYSLPLEIFNMPVGNCYIQQNTRISDLDKKGMKEAYPAVTYQVVDQQHNAKIESLIKGGKLSTIETAALRVLKRS